MKKIKTSFTIYLEDPYFCESVFCHLKHSKFEVSKIGQEEKELFAIKNVANCIEATNLEAYVTRLDGVKDAIPTYEYVDDQVKWYKTSLIPIILSALITALTILVIVYPLDGIDDTHKSLSIIIPTSITVFIQIIYRYFREEPII